MGDYRTTRGEKPPPTMRERRVFRGRVWSVSVLAILLIWSAGHWIRIERSVPASGYVTTAAYAEVRAPLAGQVRRIARTSGERVEAGELLVQIDDTAERALLTQAECEAQRVEAELALREAELAEQRRDRASRVAVAALTLEHSRRRLELTGQLADKGLASGRELMEDTFKVGMAEAEHQRLLSFDAGLDERRIEVLRRTVDARRQAVLQARAAVELRAIRAPLQGRLLRHTFFAGEVVRPDMVLYEIFGGDDLVLKLRVPERYATRVAINQAVRAQLRSSKMLFRPRWLHGSVGEVRDAIQSEGAQTYRLIYCTFDPAGLEAPPGTTADARIRVGRGSLWTILFDQ